MRLFRVKIRADFTIQTDFALGIYMQNIVQDNAQPNQPTILQKIVQDKAIWVAQKEQAFPLSEFQHKIVKATMISMRLLPKAHTKNQLIF